MKKNMKKIALTFPGQGSQTVGMLSHLAVKYPLVEETFVLAAEVLGYDLWQIVQTGSEEQLNQTEYSQPALLAADVAVWRVWQQKGGATPSLVAGHSLGEYAALVSSEVISFSDAVQQVRLRAQIMQRAMPVGVGAMAAIVGLDADLVRAICIEAAQGEELDVANYNSPQQIVVAGKKGAIERAIALAKMHKAKIAKVLPISIPSHCSLMKDAANHLREQLMTVEFKPPKIPVVSNVDAAIYNDPVMIKDALIRQLYSPVRWVETIVMMQNYGIEGIFECGPGKVLQGLNKRIAQNLVTGTLDLPENLNEALAFSNEG
jgi:[acyl-carrier-protein] S-malonyltransferase